jgi:hypothetical protein
MDKPTSTYERPLDTSLEMAVLAHLLQAERSKAADLFDTVAALLQASVPAQTTVTVGGWPWSKKRPVTAITVDFSDEVFELSLGKSGAVSIKQRKIVRGITLKSTDISMEKCLTAIVAKLAALEKDSEATRAAMEKLVFGR